MPIYEYKSERKGCPKCSKGFEALQGIHESPLRACPYCHGEVRKLISRLGRIDMAYSPSDAFKHYTKNMEERQRKTEKEEISERSDAQ